MKKTSILISALMLFSFIANAQSNSRSFISHQVDSLKEAYSRFGFEVVKESAINMDSEYEMPVIVPLNEGSWYQFVFIGEYSSRLYEVRMYDWQEKQVVFRQNKWGDVDGNIISYSYVPRFSEFHMMKPVQVNKEKKKNLNGYVMLFKRTTDTGSIPPASGNTIGAR